MSLWTPTTQQETLDGWKLPHPWNAKHLRKYYPYNHVYIYSACIFFSYIAYKSHVLKQLII